MIRDVLQSIANRLPIRPIYHEGGLYLKRYHVCTLFGYWRVYLHHFMMSDPDGLHNHPFRYSFSLILAGWYRERTRWGLQEKRWFNWISPDKMHRVELHTYMRACYPDEYEATITCWSIFVHSPRRTHWAFLRNGRYDRVSTDTPTPLSSWYKDAPSGAKWESWTDEQKLFYRNYIEERYRIEASKGH